jgi:DNA-binding NtrC family response regulator
MVKQHQGWIEVESQPGKGACFHITLPSAAKPAEKPAPRPALSKAQGGKETVLLVEDELDLRELVREILEGQGYHVLEASTGAEAIRLWEGQGQKIDLLLSDMVMPEGMSGRDLAEKLQKTDPSLPVIITSGYSQDMIERDSALDERIRFFSKPFHPAQLAQAVRECLDSRKRNGEAAKEALAKA